jgi:hypothetical protein
LAQRVKRDDGQFPVTAELVIALLGGFAAFNQMLFALLGWLMAHDGRETLAGRFALVSLIVGAVAWTLVQWAQKRSRGRLEGGDLMVAVLTWALFMVGIVGSSPLCAVGGTVGAIGWVSRGWFRRRKLVA